MTTPTPHGAMPELPNIELARAHGARVSAEHRHPDDPLISMNGRELAAYTRAAIQQAAGAVPEGRSDKDYAIEHAEYMATAAEQLAYSVDALDAAHLLDGETPGGADDAVNEAHANYIEARKDLRSAVYEFRKRRDRAASPSSPVQPDSGHLGAGGSQDHLAACAGGGVMLPTPPAQRWQVGTWTLTAPDGRTWQADSPLKACSAEQRDRIPPEVALKRIFDALDEGGPT